MSDPAGHSGDGASEELRSLLRRHGIRPRKSLGQNFLADASYLDAIVAAANLRPTDTVLEIGPGTGTLTVALAERAGRVVAVEVDPELRAVLAALVARRANVTIIAADILAVDPAALVGATERQTGRLEGYKVVANLPYYITSAVLRRILEARVRPELAVLMVQKEVGERLLAEPGSMGVLSVSVQFYARPRAVVPVPARAFHPSPKVDSMVVRLDVHASPPVDVAADQVPAYFRLVRAGFAQKRKQLRNSLSTGLDLPPGEVVRALECAGIDPRRRAETLSLAEWARLLDSIG